jgi:hypothetical protein
MKHVTISMHAAPDAHHIIVNNDLHVIMGV